MQVSNWFINARVRLWKPMVEEMYKEEFGAEMDSTNSSSENAGNKHGKVDEAACSEDQDRDEFQSTSTHAGASQLLNAYKSEPVGSMDAGPLSSLGGGDMGTYAPGSAYEATLRHLAATAPANPAPPVPPPLRSLRQ